MEEFCRECSGWELDPWWSCEDDASLCSCSCMGWEAKPFDGAWRLSVHSAGFRIGLSLREPFSSDIRIAGLKH